MTIIHRRVFFAKVGMADHLVGHLQEGEGEFRRRGVDFKVRILTDYMSGRSDRVVAEWEVNDLAEIDVSLNRVMGDPAAQEFFGTWLEGLNDLIHYAEAENWTVH